MLLSIPIKYWLGDSCLSLGIPWMVPGAIYELDILLCPSDCVLEFGSGGSTLFFARRCHEVYSYETDIDWHNSVRDILNRDTGVIASAVVYSYCPHVLGLENAIYSRYGANATVLVVDTVHGYNRSVLLDAALHHCRSLRLIVLDNYSSTELFPLHHDWSDEQFSERLGGVWRSITFDDIHWHGSGTRLLYRL